MEIFNNNRIQQAASVYKQHDIANKKSEGAEKTGLVQKPDRIELSPASQEISRIKSILDKTPEVSDQKVDELRSRVESGTYNVDSREIAKAMLQEIQGGN